MKCTCQSYNRPEITGDTEPVIADPNLYFKWDSPARIVCLDICIADEVLALWKASVWTRGSCCGHNGLFERSIILENWQDAEKARRLIKDHTILKAWKLTTL